MFSTNGKREEGINRWAQGIFRTVRAIHSNDGHMSHLSKPIVCTTRMNSNINSGIKIIITYWFWLFSCSKCAALIQYVNNRGNFVAEGGVGIPYGHSFYNIKTVLLILKIQKKKGS